MSLSWIPNLLSWKRYKNSLSIVLGALRPRQNIGGNETALILPAARVVLLPIALIWFLGFVVFVLLSITSAFEIIPELGTVAGQFGDSFNVLNSVFSGFALGVIALSLFIQRADLRATLDEMEETNKSLRAQVRYLELEGERNVREFGATFQAQPLKEARSAAYILRAPFFTSGKFRKVLADQWISGEDVMLPKECQEFIIEANRGRVSESTIRRVRNHTWHISDLIEFYSTLYQHCDSLPDESKRKIAKMLGEKYIWPYWRGMLLLLALEVARLYEGNVETTEECEQFPKPHWIRDLVVFDRWVMPHRYKPNTHPRERLYVNGNITFDDDYLARFVELDELEPENCAEIIFHADFEFAIEPIDRIEVTRET